ncbi:MAG: PAS domain S-box protein [Bacteroidetes bacterium]|nr:PAS domain S-box protein [Bacteroidota bacterium]
MKKLLNVLIIEDNISDAELNIYHLKRGGYNLFTERIESANEMKEALAKRTWNLILADYELPQFDAPSALRILQETGLDIPFIVVSGVIGEDRAVEMLKAGAHDYILKNNMTRLLSAVEREIQDVSVRQQHKLAEDALRVSEERFRRMFEESHVGIATLGSNGYFIRANEAFRKMMGYSDEELRSLTFREITHPAHYEADKLNVSRLVKQEIQVYKAEKRYIKKDGKVVWGSLIVTAIRDNEDQPIHFLAMVEDISNRKKAEEILRESREQLKAFAARLQTIREEERIMISRELHDNLGQSLTALKMNTSRLIKQLKEGVDSAEVQNAIGQATEMIKLIEMDIDFVRKISSDLRPRILDELGLIPALEWQLKEFEKQSGIECHLDCGVNKIGIEPTHAVGVFRIFQESLTNILRHANATRVEVRLNKKEKSYILEITDNGSGINESNLSSKTSLGLLGMRERAVLFGGEVVFHGKPGEGTKVILTIPEGN